MQTPTTRGDNAESPTVTRTVTKKELVDRIADATNLKRTDVKRVVQQFLDEIVNDLTNDARIEFRDFGVFEVHARAARVARNPRSGEPVDVPPRKSIKFKPGRLMKAGLEQTQTPGSLPASIAPEIKPKRAAARSTSNHRPARPAATSKAAHESEAEDAAHANPARRPQPAGARD